MISREGSNGEEGGCSHFYFVLTGSNPVPPNLSNEKVGNKMNDDEECRCLSTEKSTIENQYKVWYESGICVNCGKVRPKDQPVVNMKAIIDYYEGKGPRPDGIEQTILGKK